MPRKKKRISKTVETITHEEASRKNIPTAEYQSVMRKDEETPIQIVYKRRNRDLDPQLVWRGKDEQDWSDLVVHAPPLYIQEKVLPKVLIDDLIKQTEAQEKSGAPQQMDLFSDFNGLPSEGAKTEFYQHDANWSNRMILGDSLQVMASLAEREGLRGKVQCIYIDPPYGIKFNSNFQWSTTSRDVKDGKVDHITREPEQVKAFRDTWRDGIHSYLTYLRDRFTAARDLLSESGSIFLQISDENVHIIRSVLDEVFGVDNFLRSFLFKKTGYLDSSLASSNFDYILWYAKLRQNIKHRGLFLEKTESKSFVGQRLFIERKDGSRCLAAKEELDFFPYSDKWEFFRTKALQGSGTSGNIEKYLFRGSTILPASHKHWLTSPEGLKRLELANRIEGVGKSMEFVWFFNDFPLTNLKVVWDDTVTSGFGRKQEYVVETNPIVIQRCILMTTDPGDLVLDPTCGSGTTAYVAEQWGRRWITLDTSRVALALARARIMGARYPYYLLADSQAGQLKGAEVTRTVPSEAPTHDNIRQGFVYQRVQHITLKAIANNAEIDVIWEDFQKRLEAIREKLNKTLGKRWEEWEIPREADDKWSNNAKKLHKEWWKNRIARQKGIDASIAAKADFEYLYDKPYEDKKKVRVAGPFTVESLSPHRVLTVDENDELIDTVAESKEGYGEEQDFAGMILENLKTAGVQQAHKEDKINFSSITPWPGYYICAEGKYIEGDT